LIRAAAFAAALALAGAASAQSLTVRGLDGAAKTLAAAEIAALPRAEAELVEDGKPHRYEGASLTAVLRAGGLPMGARLHGDPLKAYLVVGGADGFQAVYSLAEVDRDFHGDTVILADRVDGQPLPAKQAPWRVVSSGDRKGWRAVYAVSSLEARSILPAAGAAPAMDHAH
jgi:hypothetical protein